MFRKAAWRGLHIVLCYCFYRGGYDVDLFSIRRWETFACAAGTSVGSAVARFFVVRGSLRSAVYA